MKTAYVIVRTERAPLPVPVKGLAKWLPWFFAKPPRQPDVLACYVFPCYLVSIQRRLELQGKQGFPPKYTKVLYEPLSAAAFLTVGVHLIVEFNSPVPSWRLALGRADIDEHPFLEVM
jgi:hypothetical protein